MRQYTPLCFYLGELTRSLSTAGRQCLHAMSLDCYSFVTSSYRLSQESLSSLHGNSEEIGRLGFLLCSLITGSVSLAWSVLSLCPQLLSCSPRSLKEGISILSCSTGHNSVNLTKEFNDPRLFTLSVVSVNCMTKCGTLASTGSYNVKS